MDIRRQIADDASLYGRSPDEIQLLAVSKTFPASDIQQAWQAGQRRFGENYVDEAIVKIQELSDLQIEWHYIGPIQSNKTKKIATYFDWVHSLSNEKHARRLNSQRENNTPLNVCIQVNISNEESKSGLTVSSLADFARLINDLPQLKLRGIMGIPAKETDFDKQRHAFAALTDEFRKLQSDDPDIDTLSMGMSGDMQAAIAEGSTMVRIGTAIFGKRQ